MQWYLKVLRQYVDFAGRARRTEFWMFTVISIVVWVVLLAIDVLLFAGPSGFRPLSAVYTYAVLIPSLAVAVRRLHDAGFTGWLVLAGVVPMVLIVLGAFLAGAVQTIGAVLFLIGGIGLVVLWCLPGRPGTNRFGQDPRVRRAFA